MRLKDKMMKKILMPILLGIMMLTSCLTVASIDQVYASGSDNSIYIGAEIRHATATNSVSRYDIGKSADYKKCVEQIREGLKNHKSSIVIEIVKNNASVSCWNTLPVKLINEALAHNGKNDEGDYIRYQMSGYTIMGSIYSSYYRFEFCKIGYFTTKKQEDAVTTECNRIIKSLKLSGLDNYSKIYKIYDYLCKNVSYDWTGYYDNRSTIEHSAYAALIRKKAVCQGYSVALYRLLLQAGIDARVVTGTLCGEAHSWVIAKLGDKYYCLDATNDAGHKTYTHFLREDNYDNHVRKYNTYESDFDKKYPISKKKYVKEAANTHNYGSPSWSWTGTSKVVATFVCKNDSGHIKKVTAKITTKITKKATTTTPGKKTYTATVTLNNKNYKNTKTVEYYLFDKNKTGLQKYNGVLYYTKNGVRYSSFTGFAKYGSTWYYVTKGCASTAKTGIYKGKVNGKNGSWYVKKGKVQLSFTGTVKLNNKKYKIKNGMVVK